LLEKTAGRISALKRLRGLPVVFTLSDLAKYFGWDGNAASQYLIRWRRQELIKPVGPRAGMFCNLIAEAKQKYQWLGCGDYSLRPSRSEPRFFTTKAGRRKFHDERRSPFFGGVRCPR